MPRPKKPDTEAQPTPQAYRPRQRIGMAPAAVQRKTDTTPPPIGARKPQAKIRTTLIPLPV